MRLGLVVVCEMVGATELEVTLAVVLMVEEPSPAKVEWKATRVNLGGLVLVE